MKTLLSFTLAILCLSAFSQPFNETIITDNFSDAYTAKVADLDGNTYDDIVAAGVGGIVWFKNTNGNDFETIMILDSILVRDIDLVDYDFDTDMDMVGFNSTSGILFTLINDGSENFTYNIITDTLSDIKQITAADIDNDNDIDIFFNIYDGGFYDVYLYEYDAGVYLPAIQVDRVDYSKDIYVFDYENDNDLDFLTKTNYFPYDTEEIGIMVNDGTNTFTEIVVYENTDDININDAQFVDIDNNGTGDLVIADNVQNELYWLEDAGSTRHNILATADPSSVLVQDYNNDGVMDVSYKDDDSSDRFFFVLQGNNPGPSMTFTQVYSVETEVLSTDLESIDTDKDNLPEWAYTVAANDEVGFFKNDGAFSFTINKLASNIPNPACLRRVDLDLDGDTDILSFATNSDLVWFELLTDGSYEKHTIISAMDKPSQFEVEDMNIDGYPDIITTSTGDDDFSIWYNDGNQVFTEQYITYSNTQLDNPAFFSIADLDNDGDKDFAIVAAAVSSNPKGIFWIRNEGGGTFSSPIAIQSGLNYMGEVTTCDFDNDGNIDIIVADGAYGNAGLRTIKNNGGGSFTVSSPVSFRTETLRLGDIDSDGLMDFVTRNDVDNDIVWFKNNGDFTFTENTIVMSEGYDVKFELCDAGNDNITDIFFYTNYFGFTNNAGFTAGILTNDGSEVFTQTNYVESQTNLLSAIATDFENDGDVDFILGYVYSGKISVYENLATDLIDPVIISWPVASDILIGESLANSILSGGSASVPGTFDFTDPSIIPEGGYYNAEVQFTPDDPVTYNNVLGSVQLTVNKITPTVTTWPTATDIEYGQSLSASVLSGGSASVAGTFTFSNPAITPPLGTYTADVTFTPDDFGTYNTVSGTADVEVLQATPTITTWPTATAITYGEDLSFSVLSGGVSSVTGTFSFDTPATIPDAGIYTADITFTPDDNINYSSVNGTVNVTVNKADPVVDTWPTASDITYGDELSLSVLSGGNADMPGIFSFDVPATTPDAGVYTADITFTPDDNLNYNNVSGTVDVNVNKADPVVSVWATASDITYGDELSLSVLSGGNVDVPGTFSFDAPTTTPNAGIYTADVTFTPTDNTNYNNISGTVDVNVNKADPIVDTWPSASDITYGDELSLSVLSGGNADVAGTFGFDTPTTVPDAGTYAANVTFTPDDDLNYNPVSITVNVEVLQAIPTITTWPAASDITYGDELSISVLSGGSASVSGTFSFDLPTTTPDAGVYTADITFIPDDIANYITIPGTVDVTVNKADPVVDAWPTASDISYGDELSLSVLSGGNADVAGAFSFDAPTTTPDAGIYTADVTFTPTDNTNYNNVNGTVNVNVNKVDPVVDTWPTASDITYGDELSLSVLSGGNADVAGTFSFDAPATTPDAGIYTADVTFTPTDNTNYNSISETVDVNVNKADPVVDTWPTASDITYGDELSTSVLSGGNADIAGDFSFDAPATSPDAGTYTANITFIPTDNTNYNNVNGTVDVTINKADQTIDWTQELDVYYGAIITLEATSSSGLTVDFISDNTNVAVVTGDQLEIVGYGTANIVAMQDGDDNYNPAEDISKLIDVIVSSPVFTQNDEINIYPNPAKELLFIENKENAINSYSIYDITGKLICKKHNVINNIIRIHISEFMPGQYLIKLSTDNGISNKTFIKL